MGGGEGGVSGRSLEFTSECFYYESKFKLKTKKKIFLGVGVVWGATVGNFFLERIQI